MSERSCAKCVFWVSYNQAGDPSAPDTGECKRYPPKGFSSPPIETRGKDWCGEFLDQDPIKVVVNIRRPSHGGLE